MKYSPNDAIVKIPLVGKQYSIKLERLGINNILDLLNHYPSRYEDTRNIISIQQLLTAREGTILVTIEDVKSFRTKRGRFLTKATVQDNSESLEVVWFNQPYLTKTLHTKEKYLLSGKITKKWGTTLSNPQFESAEKSKTVHLGKLTPIYPETYGVSSKWLRARISYLKPSVREIINDNLTEDIIDDEKLMRLDEAILKIHFPDTEKDIDDAQERLGLNELIKIQLEAQKHIDEYKDHKGVIIDANDKDKAIKKIRTSLDFTLTSAQEKSIEEILLDLGKGKPMRRLLNGDVGSGKTIVALIACVAVCQNGHTAIIMAPTTILAQQHFENIKKILKKADIKTPVKLITSAHKDTLGIEPQIIIGTHAILFKKDLPQNTALIVIDEQHRFGVSQRKQLAQHGNSTGHTHTPHYLTMTATPIPRTLTMALYGYTDVSTLDEMPKARKVIKTHLVPNSKRTEAYDWITSHLQDGDQAFIICPLIDESEKIKAKAVTDEFKRLKDEVFSGFEVGLMHGRIPSKEKNTILKQFSQHKFDILVSTPVVEVGIDIPNATIMVIENAERFGLAQLHQFRGRVGRGAKQSYCFLFSDSQSQASLARLKFFSQNNSGFKVAEYDLKTRGPGEVYGTRQSGVLNLRFADLSNTTQTKQAQKIAHLLTA